MNVFVNIRDDDAIIVELGLFKIKIDSKDGDVLAAFVSAIECFGQFVIFSRRGTPSGP